MEQLRSDPILMFYAKMSKSTEYETILPEYNETSLRLAFAQVLGKLRPPGCAILQLYRQLVLLQYSQTYKSVHDLNRIMPCFSIKEIQQCHKQTEEILIQWRQFTRVYLSSYIYKDALFEMLYEWKYRYEQIFGEPNNNQVRRAAIVILKFLGGSNKSLSKWLRSFYNLFGNPSYMKPKSDAHKQYTQDDLRLVNIFEVIKPKLNSLVYETMMTLEDTANKEEPDSKKFKLDSADEKVFIGEIGENDEETKSVMIPISKSEDSKTGEDFKEYEHSKETNISTQSVEESDTLQLLAIMGSDSEEETEVYSIDLDNCNNDADVSVKIDSPKRAAELSIVNYDTAMHYVSALQAYAVVHGHYEAIGLLDRLDTDFRKRLT